MRFALDMNQAAAVRADTIKQLIVSAEDAKQIGFGETATAVIPVPEHATEITLIVDGDDFEAFAHPTKIWERRFSLDDLVMDDDLVVCPELPNGRQDRFFRVRWIFNPVLN